MHLFAVRLLPGQDLKEEIEKTAHGNNIKAAIILSAVGSLKQANLRLAGAKESKFWEEDFEIVSATGTLSIKGYHIHISVSDKNGNVYGGHLQEGCIVNTTVELVIEIIENLNFARKLDPKTGWKELVIQ